MAERYLDLFKNLQTEKRIIGKVGSVLNVSVSLGSQISLIGKTGQAFVSLAPMSTTAQDSFTFLLLLTPAPEKSLAVSSFPGPSLRRQVRSEKERERERKGKMPNLTSLSF